MDNDVCTTPIAIFAYNRPAHLEQTLAALERCARLEECSLHLYCDGPKGAADAAAVLATRAVARTWASRMGARLVAREANVGLACSIVEGVSELCARHGRAIVVEDDIVVSTGFVDYMLRALEHYAGDPRVYQISGYMFPVRHRPRAEACFLPLTTTWGWATWERAWRGVDWSASEAPVALKRRLLRWRFDFGGSYPYADMLRRRLAGENDSWGIIWWWAVFRARGLALFPRESLVQNIGFDGTGTHCGVEDRFTISGFTPDVPPPRLPDRVRIDRGMTLAVAAYFRGDRPSPLARGAGYLRRHASRLLSASSAK